MDDKKQTNLDTLTVKRNPTSNNELGTEKYLDDDLIKLLCTDSIKH